MDHSWTSALSSLHLCRSHTELAREGCWYLLIGTQCVTDTILISPYIDSFNLLRMKKWIVLLPPFYIRNVSSNEVKHPAQGHVARSEQRWNLDIWSLPLELIFINTISSLKLLRKMLSTMSCVFPVLVHTHTICSSQYQESDCISRT